MGHTLPSAIDVGDDAREQKITYLRGELYQRKSDYEIARKRDPTQKRTYLVDYSNEPIFRWRQVSCEA